MKKNVPEAPRGPDTARHEPKNTPEMLKQLFETHLDVADLDRAMAFYEHVLELNLGMYDEARRIAFYWVGGPMRTMLGLWEKKSAPIVSRHLAFEVELEQLRPAIAALAARGVATRDFWNNATREPFVFGWMPAAAIYFDDPDGHMLELIARVPGEARPDLPIVTWGAWQER